MKTIYKICSRYLIIPKDEEKALKRYSEKLENIEKCEEIKQELEEFLENRNYETKGYIFAKLLEILDTS